MFVTRQLTVAIDCHSRKKNTMEVNEITNILQNIFFWVQQKKKKLIQAWNKLKVS